MIVPAPSAPPSCEHGPCLLFERYKEKKGDVDVFWACAVYRDRKACPFYLQYGDELKTKDRRAIKLAVPHRRKHLDSFKRSAWLTRAPCIWAREDSQRAQFRLPFCSHRCGTSSGPWRLSSMKMETGRCFKPAGCIYEGSRRAQLLLDRRRMEKYK